MRGKTTAIFIIFAIFAGLVCLLARPGWADTATTMSTYYPSPFGSYQDLRLAPRAALDLGMGSQCADLGTMYVDKSTGQLMICDDSDRDGAGLWQLISGVWQQTKTGDRYGIVPVGTTDLATSPRFRAVIGAAANPVFAVGDTDSHQLYIHDPELSDDKATEVNWLDSAFPYHDMDVLIDAVDVGVNIIGQDDSTGLSYVLFKEVDAAGTFQNQWLMGRRTQAGGGEFQITYDDGTGSATWPGATPNVKLSIDDNVNAIGIGQFGSVHAKPANAELHIKNASTRVGFKLLEANGAAPDQDWEFRVEEHEADAVKDDRFVIYGGVAGSETEALTILTDPLDLVLGTRVGIGTAYPDVPEETLHIKGDGRLTLEDREAGGVADALFLHTRNGTVNNYRLQADSGVWALGIGDGTPLDGVDQWYDRLTIKYQDEVQKYKKVHVGINTRDPQADLHVAGNGSIWLQEYPRTGSGASTGINFKDTDSEMSYQLGSSGQTSFMITGISKCPTCTGQPLFSITKDGNAIIGKVSTPNKPFMVATGPGTAPVAYLDGVTSQFAPHPDPTTAPPTAAFCAASSREFKQDIRDLDGPTAVDVLSGLTPVRFNYRVGPQEESVGFIAEDVPDLVAAPDRKALGRVDIVAVITRVIQDQQSELEHQQALIEEQQRAIDELFEQFDQKGAGL